MNSRIKEDVSRLFEFWCEIAPGSAATSPAGSPVDKAAATTAGGGHIVQSFPESFKDAKVIADIPSFAFPCSFERRTIQVHSFVLTNIDSKWRFGFCRHDPKSPTAMVIVTYLPWHDTFIRFLNVLADVRKNSQQEFETFLAEAYNRGVPEPGGCLKLQYDRPVQTFSFQRPQQFLLPSIPENHNLNLYYNFVEPKAMIGVFAAMLAERRIIFVSRRLDILSSCIQAANAFLYPMVWQHIFIPVLPMKMRDILGAPMPFLIGVPEAVYESLRREEIGDVVILNCDKRTLDTPFDDVKNMPPELVASLKKHLANSAEHRGDRVSKIFLGILVQLIGGYRDAVKFNDKITFDPETFIDTRPSHLRPFLANMLQLQIFQQFIEERLDMLNTGQGFSDEFEVECFRYAEKSGRKVKQYKDLLKNFKDKTNPAVRSAVKSVKEGGKGVKTAYKGLRSKFRETTPPKSKLDSSGIGMHSHVSQYDMGHHQSAPNSPVFNKRPQTIALPDDASYPGQHMHNMHNHHAAMLTPSSTSLYNSPHYLVSNNAASHNNYNTITAGCAPSATALKNQTNNNNNSLQNHFNNSTTGSGTTAASSTSDVRSPSLSLSPTSSNSSSEMNLLQELQHLALFKSPAVNRNLKPTFSLDSSSTNRPSSRTGAPLSPPGNQTLPRIQELVPSSSHQQQPLLLQLDLNGSASSPRHHRTRNNHRSNNNEGDDIDGGEDRNFDLSPDMPCPPVPPRRFQTAAEALAAIQISPPPMSPPSSSSSTSASPYRNYNHFLQQATAAAAMQQSKATTPPAPPPLKASAAALLLDDGIGDGDDDQLMITLTPNNSLTTSNAISNTINSNNASQSQIVLESSSSSSGIIVSSTLPRPTSNSHHQHHHKPPAPQPPQRPPLAPKPTTLLRKESSCVDVADTNARTAAAAASTSSLDDDPAAAEDLINLDTTNSSFELEDFDPLNEHARPIPAKPQQSALTKAHSPATVAPSAGFNNPIYPYFTPTHLHAKAAPHHHHHHSLSQGGSTFHHTTNGGLGSGSGSGSGVGRAASVQDDFELLRNYGLDKFSLIDGASSGQEKQQHHMAGLLSSTSPSGVGSSRIVNSFVNGGGRPNSAKGGTSAGTIAAAAGCSRTAAFSNWTTFD